LTEAVALRSQTVLTGSGSHRYSYGGFGAGHQPSTRMLAVGRNLHPVSTRSPRQFHLPGADHYQGCLRIRTPAPEMAGQSPRKRPRVSRHQNGGRAFLVI
jgi:hypothetical protein